MSFSLENGGTDLFWVTGATVCKYKQMDTRAELKELYHPW